MAHRVYILSIKSGSVLYTGCTNDLSRRILEHWQKAAQCFTPRYNVTRLVYYEVTDIEKRCSCER